MVMHARKPQRMSDGFFEKHQAHPYQSNKYNSKRDYERETSNRSSSNYRDNRDNSSPSGSGNSGGGGNGNLGNNNNSGNNVSNNTTSSSMNNGNSSYRSQSPELDSPPRHDIRDRSDRGGGDRGERCYIQKMRDRDRDNIYNNKKEKYSDKRDRRGGGPDRDPEHRTNHDRIDRRSKMCTSSVGGGAGGDKRSGSDDRDRDRERDLRDSKRDRNERDRRDRNDRGDRNSGGGGAGGGDRDRERNDRGGGNGGGGSGERTTRIGDWSEHVSSSGKMYYYNCKTEVSQWEKPKEWLEKERSMVKDQHREREYREKERERDREDRFSRSSVAYTKHSSSRGNSRLRWPYEIDSGPPAAHRRRHEDNPDMDISPGDSTPTSEASYSLTGTPTTQINDIPQQHTTSTLSSTSVNVNTIGGNNGNNQSQQTVLLANALPRLASHPPSQMHFNQSATSIGGSSSSSTLSSIITNNSGNGGNNSTTSSTNNNNSNRKLDGIIQQSNLTSVSSPTQTGGGSIISSSSVSVAPSININHLQHHYHHSQSQQQNSGLSDHHINSNAPGPPIQQQQSKLAGLVGNCSGNIGMKSMDQVDLVNPQKLILRQGQQPQTHHGILSSIQVSGQEQQSGNNINVLGPHNTETNHSTSGVINLRENALNSPLYNLTHMHGMSPLLNHNKNQLNTQIIGNSGYNCSNTPFGLKTVEGVNAGAVLTGSGTAGSGDGPPTPTQELDISGNNSEQRKLEGTSASLSSLQSCVTSVQSGRSQGPDLSPKLAKYFRADLITHVTNWPADMLEKQAQKCSEETHIYGDLSCTKVSAELKCARSLVRITEITATLQEQKIMYLRQQIRRLEESKSQNSFMSDDL